MHTNTKCHSHIVFEKVTYKIVLVGFCKLFVSGLVFHVFFISCSEFVSTSAIDCLVRLSSEMVSYGM